MLAKGLLHRVLTIARGKVAYPKTNALLSAQRHASTNAINCTNNQIMLDRALLQQSIPKESVSVATVSEYVSRLRPFSAPAPPQPAMITPTKVVEELEMTSVLRKRRLKMNKHKHKKLRKRTRALRKKLGK